MSKLKSNIKSTKMIGKQRDQRKNQSVSLVLLKEKEQYIHGVLKWKRMVEMKPKRKLILCDPWSNAKYAATKDNQHSKAHIATQH